MTETPLTDIALTTLDGSTDHAGRACRRRRTGRQRAPRNAVSLRSTRALEKLAKDYGERGLTVIGVPCNQFMGQEPGTAEEIQTFCSTTYGVTFPLLAKTDVNGADRHPLYAELTKTPDAAARRATSSGTSRSSCSHRAATVVNRFRPRTVPDAPEVIAAIEAVLPR